MKTANFFLTIISVSIIIMMFIISLFNDAFTKRIGGTAAGGYKNEQGYYLLFDDEYNNTTRNNWYFSKAVYIIDTAFFYIGIVAVIYIILRIFIYNFFKDK